MDDIVDLCDSSDDGDIVDLCDSSHDEEIMHVENSSSNEEIPDSLMVQATKIQNLWRGYCARMSYHRDLLHIIIVQSLSHHLIVAKNMVNQCQDQSAGRVARKITDHKQPELMDQIARTIQTARRGHYACSDGKHQISFEDTDEASLKVASTSSSKKQCLNHEFPSDGMTPLKHVQTREVVDLCDSSDDENSSSNEETPHVVMPLDHFLKMWGVVEEDILGCSTQEIEQSESFRKANATISKEDSDIQEKAQYGRFMFKGTDAIFKKVMELEKSHVFLDIGHGLGNMVLQAAYAVGWLSITQH